MTGYNFESTAQGFGIVDLKATNLHMSAKPDSALNTPASAVFTSTLALPYTCIPAGVLVCVGGDSGSVDVADGTNATLGVAIDARVPGDARPITYTWQGYVRLIAGTGGVNAGDLICADDGATYLGCAKKWASDDTSATTITTQQKKVIGKALTQADAGKQFEAIIDCSGA